MININTFDNYFDYTKKNTVTKIVYGAGNVVKSNYKLFGAIDFFCDRNADSIKNIAGIPCISPENLEKINNRLSILVCIANEAVFYEICTYLNTLEIDAEVFYLYKNPAFNCFQGCFKSYQVRPKDKLKIRIVYSQDGWIFGKFASKMEEELLKLGQEVSISNTPDFEADVNHYISYSNLTHLSKEYSGINTTMITHIDTAEKRELISFQTEHDVVGVCMSQDTMNKLTSWGIKREKLCYINPAQDGIMRPKKIVLGITNRCYSGEDLRKNDRLIVEVCKELDPDLFEIKIMGAGWDSIVEELQNMGFSVTYYNDFVREIYYDLMPSLDYWLYYGFDEGAMGYLDALAAGVKTIVTPQGYHLDTIVKPTYLCSTVADFIKVLKNVQDEKKAIVNAVSGWTWDNYARKHLEVWQYLKRMLPLKDIYINQGQYMDGIFSLLLENNCI